MSRRLRGAPWRRVSGVSAVVLTVFAALVPACSSNDEVTSDAPRSPSATSTGDRIVIHADRPLGVFDPRLLGTNAPAWLGPELLGDEGFRATTVASGVSVVRLPGGSWSNSYDWLGCETGDAELCPSSWAARPSDFLDFLMATGLAGMWTVSINGTPEEAAALVAFFNGEVDDERPIGRDRNGRDWQTVGAWARLRAEHGHPRPEPIQLWEVGNEVYGAVDDAGPNCASFGWEEVWTCDGKEYVTGTDEHDGFVRFRSAMQAVDPDIEVGTVGVADQGSWSDWGNAVMSTAGDAIDFYVVHHYGFDGDVDEDTAVEVPGQAWPEITQNVRDGFERHGLTEAVEIAVTEHNLVSFIDSEDAQLMTTALNAFYLAGTIGQLALNGVEMANQWNLANGRAENGGDYGLIDVETGARYPAYYATALWSRFGDELVEVELGDDPGLAGLLIFGGRDAGGAPRLLVVNPSDAPVEATIAAEPAPPEATVSVDVMAASSSTDTAVTFNGSDAPSPDLTDPAPAQVVSDVSGNLDHEFPAYSITLLSWDRSTS